MVLVLLNLSNFIFSPLSRTIIVFYQYQTFAIFSQKQPLLSREGAAFQSSVCI